MTKENNSSQQLWKEKNEENKEENNDDTNDDYNRVSDDDVIDDHNDKNHEEQPNDNRYNTLMVHETRSHLIGYHNVMSQQQEVEYRHNLLVVEKRISSEIYRLWG